MRDTPLSWCNAFLDTGSLMAKLVLAVTEAALVTISLARIERVGQASCAPETQSGGGGT